MRKDVKIRDLPSLASFVHSSWHVSVKVKPYCRWLTVRDDDGGGGGGQETILLRDRFCLESISWGVKIDHSNSIHSVE